MISHNILQAWAVKYLEHLEEKLQKQGISYGENGCGRHTGHEVDDQDLCPCEARIFYYFDRIEESYHRLHRKNDRFGSWRWLLWYLRSSREYLKRQNAHLFNNEISAWNPLFPRKSLNVFHQHKIGTKPWIRYKICSRRVNGAYLPEGGLRSSTPHVGRKKK